MYQTEHHVSASDLTETVNILNNRVNGLGVSGAQVNTTGTNEITVAIPGLKDPAAVLSAIGQTARLNFRPVLCYAPPYTPTTSTQSGAAPPAPGPLPASCPAPYQLVTSNLSGSPTSENGVGYNVGADPALASYPTSTSDSPNAVVLQNGPVGSAFKGRYLEGPAELSGTAVKTASAQLSPTGQWVVDITLTGPGSNGWNAMTMRYFHEIIGIELDGVVQTAPITQSTQGHVVFIRGPGGDLWQLHPAECAEPRHRPAVRLLAGGTQATDLSDGLAHSWQVGPRCRARGGHRRARPGAALCAGVLPRSRTGGDLGVGNHCAPFCGPSSRGWGTPRLLRASIWPASPA